MILYASILLGSLLLNLAILYIANASKLVKVNTQCEKLVEGIRRNTGIIIFCASIGALFYIFNIVSANSRRNLMPLVPWFGAFFIFVAVLLVVLTIISCLIKIPRSIGDKKPKIFLACFLCIVSALLASIAILAMTFYGFSLYDIYQSEIGSSKTAVKALFSLLDEAKALIR